MMRAVGLVGDEEVDVGDREPGAVEGLGGGVDHPAHRVAEDGLALHPQLALAELGEEQVRLLAV